MTVRGGPIGQRSETVRRANLSALVRELHVRGPASRSELVAHTGLTRTGIRGLVSELSRSGLVFEQRAASRGTPGRPSVVVCPNPGAAEVLALEIAVDSLAAAVVGLGGTVRRLERVDRTRDRLSVESTAADLADLARLVCARPLIGDPLIGIGVAVVGVTRRTDGFVSIAPNLGWHDVALGATLSQALGTTLPISVANEADLGALAEHRRGAAVGAEDVLFVSGEVGVGGGLIVGGRALTGAAGYGGEVGHIPVNPNGLPCGCGSVGCWETEVAEGALLRHAGRPTGGGRNEVETVLGEAAAGVPTALSALDSIGHWLGFGIAGLVNVLNPRLVVLGGLFGRIYPFVAHTMRGEIERRALAASREMVEIRPATLGIQAPLLGAAELAFEPLLADPSAWMRGRVRATETTRT